MAPRVRLAQIAEGTVMKTAALFGVAALLVLVPVAGASVTDVTCANDGDGAINCAATWDDPNSRLDIVRDQFWSRGHMLGDITIADPDGPAMMMRGSADNDSGFASTGCRRRTPGTLERRAAAAGRVVTPPPRYRAG